MKAIVRLKDFPGHVGRPGEQGGSEPRGSGNADLDKLHTMFVTNNRVKNLKNDVAMHNGDAKRYYARYTKYGYNANDKKQYEDAMTRYYAAKDEYDAAKKEFKIASKDVKAPGYGEWKAINTAKSLGGSWTYYEHPDHPEYGKLGVNHFGGYSMQHVAPSSTVEYNNSRMEWSGGGARQSANIFVKTVFGI